MEADKLLKQVKQYKAFFEVFKEAEEALISLEDKQREEISLNTKINVLKDDLEDINQKVISKEEEYKNLVLKAQEKQKEEEEKLEKLAQDKLFAATRKAKEILREADEKFKAAFDQAKVMEEDVSSYGVKLEQTKAELQVVEEKLARAKNQVLGILQGE